MYLCVCVSYVSYVYLYIYIYMYRPWSDWRARYFASAEGLVKTDEETPDEDVARRDLVRGLLRMNLLPRLRYLLEVRTLSSPLSSQRLCARQRWPTNVCRATSCAVSCAVLQVARLETAVVEDIFDVLIRVARHSPAAAHLVAECPRLWPCVRLLFIEVFPDKSSQACLPPPPPTPRKAPSLPSLLPSRNM